jgi:uncharacterized membrane protein YpjA
MLNKKLIKIRKDALFAYLLAALVVGVAFGHIWHLGQLAGI